LVGRLANQPARHLIHLVQVDSESAVINRIIQGELVDWIKNSIA
jgi:hypothetical protein